MTTVSARRSRDKQALLPLIPDEHKRLPDGQRTHQVLWSMMSAWRDGPAMRRVESLTADRAPGGHLYLRRNGHKYRHITADAYYQRTPEPSALLHAINWHAGARMWMSGYRGSVLGSSGPCEWWGAQCLRADFVPVALAVLELDLTGNTALAEWYLSTNCFPYLCNHHGGDRRPRKHAICGSTSCEMASPDTSCDCICQGVNHGMGQGAGTPQPPEPADWSTMPVTWGGAK